MPLSNTSFNLNLSSQGVEIVSRSQIAIPADINTPVVLAAANPNRKGITFWNNSLGNVLIEFGAVPTLISYAFKLNPNAYYELPFLYIGTIQGLWETSGGDGLLIREFS